MKSVSLSAAVALMFTTHLSIAMPAIPVEITVAIETAEGIKEVTLSAGLPTPESCRRFGLPLTDPLTSMLRGLGYGSGKIIAASCRERVK